ncbi:hypothetical protein HX92_1446 [Mycobacterium tuberculosis]|nr:hypothetical protein BCGT_3349 [Mycobacterium tuberculosis variant bovis BCG str. ATCC 35743]AKR03403.1 hypothetical protein Mb1595_p3880 [Mycobacterium tuberculosis variant bovis]ALA80143.1 Uncharacterized protein BCGR_3828 [Mycobacterium tuberculosis variant bovis BCG]AOZ44867.1 hypothetical protein BTB1458_3871 [Mycobacterium tuberculosis]EQM17046.1 hypothetical protein GuangZ0019_3780 [Mycobacterium tuberculosis GuangZ0019]EQM17567.1 hypothetical protein FJ05194_3869 [Mycobacterium tube
MDAHPAAHTGRNVATSRNLWNPSTMAAPLITNVERELRA